MTTNRDTFRDLIIDEYSKVQPMPEVDLEKLANDPLWQSFVIRHSGKDKDDEAI